MDFGSRRTVRVYVSAVLFLFSGINASVKNHAGHEYFELQVIRLETGNRDDYKIIMGFRYIDDIVQEDMKKKQQMEETMADLKLNNEIISAISKMYRIIYRMDLIHDTYEEISSQESMHRLTGRSGKTSVKFTKARERFIAPEFQERMREFLDVSTLAERLKNREEVSTEYRAITGVWYQARFIVKLRNEAGEVTNVLYVTRDINDQKISELESREELRRTAQEAEKANLAKTDFLRRMSHDIRTPINGICGMINVADHYADNMEKQTECRAKIKKTSHLLLELINEVLDMSKLESDEVVLEDIPFNLNSIFEEILGVIEHMAAEQNIRIIWEEKEVTHWNLIGSPVHVKRILMNILSNAVKYNKENGYVYIGCREIPSKQTAMTTLEFVCRDTGIGMTEAFQKRIFEPFAQEHAGSRTKFAGTGLGMPITKKLVEKMGGTISFESKEGTGTTFVIRIPFQIDADMKDRTETEEKTETSIQGLHVLLTEDNELNMEIAEFVLQNEGAVVTKAWNGQKAVDIFRKSRPGEFDAILMDIMMPVMNGYEAAKMIRSLDREDAKVIPIIAMTANAFTEDKMRAKEAGMDEHIAKPVDGKLLVKVINELVKRDQREKL